MNNTDKMAALLRLLRTQTNGAVVGSMRDKGIEWPLSYGVSIPAIRADASAYAPDHSFAKLLYQQQVRELRLAAIIIADPQKITIEELPFWAAGVINEEVAEHLSMLLSKSHVANSVVDLWLLSLESWLSYCSLLTASRKIIRERSADWFDVRKPIEHAEVFLSKGDCFLWRALAALFNALYRFAPSSRQDIERVSSGLQSSSLPGAAYLSEELFLDPCE